MSKEPRCIHRHTIDSHPSCFAKGLVLEAKDKTMQKRIRQEYAPSPYKRVNVGKEPWYLHPDYTVGYFDIETSNLKANVGYMVSYAFKQKGVDNIIYNEITREEIMSGELDKRLIRECLKDFDKFKILVTYYGSNFDMKFVRTRATYWYHRIRQEKFEELSNKTVKTLTKKLEELLPEDRRVPSRLKKEEIIDLILDRDAELFEYEFPAFGEKYHWDLYYAVRRAFNLTRKSLGVVTEFFGIEGKTHFKPHEWTMVGLADPKIMPALKEHNVEDVIILEKLHEILNPFKKWTRTNL
jgi:uncharacterized protein YprB with RNaseH-like and TPR domain